MAQLVKNLPAMWETWVQSLGCEDALEKGRATHSSIYSCLENPMDREAWRATVHRVIKSQTGLKQLSTRARMVSYLRPSINILETQEGSKIKIY